MSGNRAALRRGCRDNGIVATWQEFETGAPQMAAAAAMLWPGITALGRGQPAPPGTPCFPVAFLVTARPEGSPRLHPFCPVTTEEVRGNRNALPLLVRACQGERRD